MASSEVRCEVERMNLGGRRDSSLIKYYVVQVLVQ